MTPLPDSSSTCAAALRKVPLFAELSPQDLEFLADRAVARHYRPGELILSEGDPCDGLSVIESGSVRIFKSSPSGQEQVLGIERALTSAGRLRTIAEFRKRLPGQEKEGLSMSPVKRMREMPRKKTAPSGKGGASLCRL